MHASAFAGLLFLDKTASAIGLSDMPNSGPTAETAEAMELVIGAIGAKLGAAQTFTLGPSFCVPAMNPDCALLPRAAVAGSDTMSIDSMYQLVSTTGTFAASGVMKRRARLG